MRAGLWLDTKIFLVPKTQTSIRRSRGTSSIRVAVPGAHPAPDRSWTFSWPNWPSPGLRGWDQPSPIAFSARSILDSTVHELWRYRESLTLSFPDFAQTTGQERTDAKGIGGSQTTEPHCHWITNHVIKKKRRSNSSGSSCTDLIVKSNFSANHGSYLQCFYD